MWVVGFPDWYAGCHFQEQVGWGTRQKVKCPKHTSKFYIEHKVRCLTTYQFSLTLICSSWPRAPWTLSCPEMKRDFFCNWKDHGSHDYNNDDKDDDNDDDKDDDNNGDNNDDKEDDHAPQVWSAQYCPLLPPRELGQSRLSWCRLFAAKEYPIDVFNRRG